MAADRNAPEAAAGGCRAASLSEPVAGAFRGAQRRPTVVLLLSTLLTATWWYFGSPEFYQAALSGRLPFGEGKAWAAAYSFLACFVLLGLLPLAVVRFAFRDSLSDYGVTLGDRVRTVRCTLLFAPFFLLAAFIGARDAALQEVYPLNPAAGSSGSAFVLHAAFYALFYLGWEFHFRGFLQMGLRGSIGPVNALLVQTLASCLLHLGKPAVETFAAIPAGIFWGLLVYRTGSLLAPILLHVLLGVALDAMILWW